MWNILYILLASVSLLLLLAVIWHLASQRWQLPCPSWLAWMVEMDNPLTKINRAINVVGSMDVAPGMKVLDAGCGPGRVTLPLASKVGPEGQVVALDIQQEMLDRVQEKALKAGLKNIQYVCAGLGDGKLEPGAFDRAVLVTVIGEIPDQKKAIQEIYDALKPGGKLVITETLFDPHYQRINKIVSLAQEVGFKKKQIVSDWFSYNLLLEKPE